MQTIGPQCAHARSELLRWRAQYGEDSGEMGVVSLALDDGVELDATSLPDEPVLQAVTHAVHCPACQQWRSQVLEPARFALRRRLQRYCCVDMMEAIDGRKPGLQMVFERLGPEWLPYWLLGPQEDAVRYCPWCGTRLPEQAFE